jgi:hypothetical protein
MVFASREYNPSDIVDNTEGSLCNAHGAGCSEPWPWRVIGLHIHPVNSGIINCGPGCHHSHYSFIFVLVRTSHSKPVEDDSRPRDYVRCC